MMKKDPPPSPKGSDDSATSEAFEEPELNSSIAETPFINVLYKEEEMFEMQHFHQTARVQDFVHPC